MPSPPAAHSQVASPHSPPWIWPPAAYIHVPFCAHKCGYCDFASLAGADDLADRYLDALGAEMAMALDAPQAVDTIFVGGGTPTRLEARQLGRLVEIIGRHFALEPGGEWTIEANPGTLDAEKADILAAAGVNRISLGAQSFHPDLLRVLERNHGPEEVPRAVELVRPRFPRWSLDLIFGIPGSTVRQCERDLETALSLGPTHLSCYGLVYEKGTSLWKQWQAGHVVALEEDVERAMYELVIDRLAAASLEMYEISNYARPGDESRHNLVYWANDAYFGFGLGAARYVDGVRSVNTRDLPAYLRRLEAGEPPGGPSERLDAKGRAQETAMLNLRRTVLGIDRPDFLMRTGHSLDDLAGEVVARFVREGLLEDDGRRVRLTREGRFLADRVLCEFV
ncbi:Oxygen-independent coproporphyrinogen-III oxidase-like protein [Aquisphaera giovannonii]|uniref:Heme chaperone HemW n=1 Tax=Aquisphaera giovannonii TaxID=406548 RepID=A0A5B9W0K0_9BACT|nr:radical SAM family heme chaperone HemW [Aquisphaera giovannonii]QEH34088.1 Oxygen-independent coproporphyrinogen-III oxidase-like protein [Aquisphaera giovannonii]